MSERQSSPVSPQAVPLGRMNGRSDAGNDLEARYRAATAAAEQASKQQGKASSEWIDVDEDRPRRRRRPRHSTSDTTSRGDRAVKTRHQNTSEGDLGRFLPKLTRILEAADPTTRQRFNTQSSGYERDNSTRTRSNKHREHGESAHRHPVKRRASTGPRRPEPIPKINPSLLSVLSSLTGLSERSSGSNSTITQQSYDRQRGATSRRSSISSGKPPMAMNTRSLALSRTKSPNVFDYMEDPAGVDDHEIHSVISHASSVSSHYQGSDAGSSEAPPTPSSRSTMPSPKSLRNPSISVAELRRKYDPDYAMSSSPSHGFNSVETPSGSLHRQRSFKDAPIHGGTRRDHGPLHANPRQEFDGICPQSSQGPPSESNADHRLRQQEQEMRQHVAYSQHPYAYEFRSSPDPPFEKASPIPEAATPSHQQSLQHYIHQPVPTRTNLPTVVRSAESPPVDSRAQLGAPPHVPEPPDLSKTTLTGYELLANELSDTSRPNESSASPTTRPQITPLYRKFTHLHHRILLHLQDELSEMESQLRVLDELIAQTYNSPPAPPPRPPSPSPSSSKDTTPAPHPPIPASRRAESHPHSPPIFAQRTHLLGRIFLKQQQYHLALRDYAASTRDSRPAQHGEIEAYKTFLRERKPIWEGEAAFLDKKEDLVAPLGRDGSGSGAGRAAGREERADNGAAAPIHRDLIWEQTAFLAALLLLPLLLPTLLPDFASRAAATALLGAGAGLVVWASRLRGERGGSGGGA